MTWTGILRTTLIGCWLAAAAPLLGEPPLDPARTPNGVLDETRNVGDRPAERQTVLRFRRLFVPENLIPSRFPNYRPLKRDTFEAEVQRINARAALASQTTARVTRAHYRTRLVGNDLLTGEATLDVVRSIREPTLLPLTPCTLAVGNLHWSDDALAVIPSGALANGEFFALIERDGGIQFSWSTRGTSGPHGERQFAFAVPRCAATRLTLELPRELEPRTTHGVIVGQPGVPLPGTTSASPASLPGSALLTWELEFGGHHDIELQLVPRMNPFSEAKMLLREAARYRISTSGVELRTTFQLDTDRSQIDQLLLTATPGLNIAAAQLGGQAVALAQRTGAHGESLIEMMLDEPLSGTHHELVVLAYAPLTTGKRWELPRVRPVDFTWQEGQAILEVIEPLSLAAMDVKEGTEAKVEPLPAPEHGESRQINYWSSAGGTEIQLDYPPREIMADVGMSIRFSELAATARLVVDLQARRGTTFVISGSVSPGWTIDSVQSEPPEVLDSFSTRGGPRQELLLRLRRAIPTDQYWRLIIRAHRRTPRLDLPVRSDIVRMVDFREVRVSDSIVSLSAEPPLHITLTGDENLQRLDPLQWGGRYAELVNAHPESILFLDRQRTKDWSVSLSREQPRFTAHVNQAVEVGAEQLTESMDLRCEPNQSFVSRILVHLSRRDPMTPQWNLVDAGDNRLSARLLSPSAEGIGGEAWELSLSRPLNRPFVINVTREQTIQGTNDLTFASLPEAVSQNGSLRVDSRGGGSFEVRVQNLQPTASSLPDRQMLPTLRGTYRFSPSQEVAATIVQLPATTVPSIAWLWQIQTESRCDASGEMLHEARLYVENTGLDDLVVQVPPHATILRVAVDHGLLYQHVVERGKLSIALPKDRRFPLITIVYRSTSPPLGLGTAVRLPQLLCELPCLAHRSRIWLPANFSVLSSAERPVESLTWDERLFGIRIWRRDSLPFDIFSSHDWGEFADSLRRLPRVLGTTTTPTTTVGWSPAHPLWTGVAASVGPEESADGWQAYDVAAGDGDSEVTPLFAYHRELAIGLAVGLWLVATGLGASLGNARSRVPVVVLLVLAGVVLITPPALVDLARIGFLGALLGIAWKRLRGPTIQSRQPTDLSSPRTSNSRSFVIASESGSLLLLAWAVGSTFLIGARTVVGQEPSETPPMADATINVLIPVDEKEQLKGDYLYVPQTLYDTIDRRANDPQGSLRGAWIEAAVYHLTLTANDEGDSRLIPREFSADLALRSFHSDSVIHVPWQRERLRILDATLDSQPLAVQWNEARTAIVIPLENDSTHRLRIVARPLQAAPELSGEFTASIASCPRSQVIVHAAGLLDRVEMTGSVGILSRDDAAGEMMAELGASVDVKVRWLSPTSRIQEQIETDVAELMWLHVQNNSLTLNGRYRFSPQNGNLSQVSFLADRRLQLLPIDKGQPVASVDIQPGDQQVIRCWLDRPYDEVTLQLSFAITGNGGFGRWPLPQVTAQATRRAPAWLGVTVTEGLIADILPTAMATKIAPSQFLAAWDENREPPQQAFTLPPNSQDWQFSVRPIPTRVGIQEQQDVLVAGDHASFRYEGVVAVDHGRLSHLRLAVPARFEPLEVTVLHDDANRLLRWSQVSEREISVFFATPLSGEIRIIVDGKVPMAGGKRVLLPIIAAGNTSSRQRQVNLFQDDDVQIKLLASAGLRVDSRNAVRSLRGRFVTSFSSDESDLPQPSLKLEVEPNRPRVTGSLVTGLSLSDDQWKATAELHLDISSGSIDAIRFHIPEELTGRIELVPPVDQQLYLAPGERGRLLVVRLPAPVDREFRLTLTSDLSLPAGDPIHVPELRVLDVATLNRYIVLPTRLQRQKALWETSGLQSTELPEEHLQPENESDFAIYQVVGPRVQAVLREVERLTGTPQVALTDYQLRWSRDGQAHGVATFYLEPSRLAEVELALPPELEPLHFKVAGLPAVGRLVAPNRWKVPVGPELLPQLVEVLFAAKMPPHLRNRSEIVLSAPTLVGIPSNQTLWTIQESQRNRLLHLDWIDLITRPRELQPTLLHTATDAVQLDKIRRDTAESLRKRGLADASQANPSEREAWRADWESRVRIIERRLDGVANQDQQRASDSNSDFPSDLSGQWLADSANGGPVVHCVLRGESPQVHLRYLDRAWRRWQFWVGGGLALGLLGASAVWLARTSVWYELWYRCPHLLLAAAGLTWWLFFVPSLLGLLILLLGILGALFPRWKMQAL